MLDITPIRAFYDNYLWLFRQSGETECGIVDPGDGAPVLEFLKNNGLTLSAIVITHHHADHTGGIRSLLQEYDVPVLGPASPNIPAVTNPLKEGDCVDLFGVSFTILEIPGHTLDHIAYYAGPENNDGTPVLFCGDTLFAGGCGRVFEGTHSMMHRSLQKLAGLDPETKVYCAHEYTLANLNFASTITPESAPLADRVRLEKEKRDQDIPTVPTSISIELATNPFLRCGESDIINAANRHEGRKLQQPEEVFAAIRTWKDSF